MSGFIKSISLLFIFGFGIVVCGMLYRIFNGTLIARVLDMFWIDGTDFLNIMKVGYNVVPIIIIIVGIIFMVVSGFRSRPQQGGSY